MPLGRPVTLAVRAEAETGRPVYQWRLNGVNIPGATDSSLTLESFQAEQGGRYEVLVAEPELGVAPVDLVTSGPVILVPDLPVAILSDPLAFTSRLPFENPTGAFRTDNTRATVQRRLGEPLHAGQPGGASVWLWWIAPQSGSVRFRTHGSAFDTLLAVYEVPNPNPSEPLLFSQLVPVVANDNASPYKTSAAGFNAVQGTHYFIAVDGVDATLAGTGRGSIVLSWAFDPPSLAFRLPEIKSQPTNATAPDGAPITLRFNVDFGTAVRTEIQWFRNGRPIDGATDLQLPISSLTPALVGRHFARIVTFDADNKPQTNQTEVVDVQIRNRSDGSDPELLAWDRYSSSLTQAGGAAAPAGLGAKGRSRPAGLARGVSGFQIFNSSLNTAESGEPTLCAGIGGKSAWYTFQADDDGVVEVDTEGSDFDTVLGAFFDDARGPGLFDGFQRLACNDDAGPGVKYSRIAFPCERGSFYTLIVDAVGGAADLARINYRLGPLLRIIAAPASQSVAVGQPVSFGVEVEGYGAKTFIWERNAVPVLTNNSPALTLSGVTEGAAGTYRVTVRNEIGEKVVSTPFTLTVTSPPTIVEGPKGLTVKAGETASFALVASGAAPLSYQWLKGGTEIPGANQPSFVIPSAQPADAAAYTVRVSNGAGFQVSAPANLTVIVPPTFVVQPVSLTVNQGQPATFAVEVSGTAPFSFQWSKGGTEIPGANQPSLVIPSAQAGDAGAYTVRVSNGAGFQVSSPASLTVIVPPSFVAQPVSLTVNQGQPATLAVEVAGTAPFTFQWSKGATEIPGANQPSFVIPSAQPADAAAYTVRVSNGAGFQVSSPASLTVIVPPSFVAQPVSLTVNQGQPATFAVEVAGTAPFTFQWSKGGTEIPGATQSSLVIPSAQAADAGAYTVRASNGAGFQVSSPASLTVIVPPTFVAQPVSLTVNEGQPATFGAEATGTGPLDFQWLKNGVAIPEATSASLVLSSTREEDAGQYSVRVSNAAGVITSATSTLVVRVPATITSPLVDLNLDEGQSGTFRIIARGTPPLVYQWFKGETEIPGAATDSLAIEDAKAADAGTYAVRVSNVAGAQTSSATLAVRLRPRIVTAPERAVVKAGDRVEFAVGVEGTAPFTFQWFRNGQPVPGATGNTLLIPAAGAGNAGDYLVRVTNAAGQVESGPVALVVNLPVSIAQQPVAQQVVPEGRAVVLAVGATGTGPLGYQWYRAGDPIPGATGSTLDLGAAEIGDSGTYTVAVSNMVNRVVSQASILTVLRSPAIETLPLPQAVEAGTAVTLTVVASGSAPLSFQWRRDGTPVPGGVTATLRIPSASAADAGLYSVVVSNPVGSVETAPVRVQVTTASAVRAVMETPQVLEDGRLRVAFTGTPGRQYLVQQSVDWVNWTTVKTVVLGASGQADYVSDGPVAGFGVFRVVTPPGVVAGVQLNPPVLMEGNRLQLTFLGSPGVEYIIEESDDLGTWRVLGSSLADEEGAGEFEAEVVPGAFRMYRVVTPATASPVSLQTPVLTPEGQVRLGIQAPAGRVLLLQESLDLLNWTTVRQVVVEPGGQAQVETPVDPAGLRWFRLVAAPGQP